MRAARKLFFLAAAAILAAPAAGLCAGPPAFSPYVESYRNGWIDWNEMAIYGIGRGMLERHGGSHPMARRAARIIALQSILKIAAGVHLDDSRSLGDLGAGPLLIELKALIHFTEHRQALVKGAAQPYYEVVLKSPMTGIRGLTGRLLDALKARPMHWGRLPKRGGAAPESDDAPWLVLDARRPDGGAPPAPALFPKILTDRGRIVYDLDRVDEAALKMRGMVRYVTLAGSTDRLGRSRGGAGRWLSGLLFPPAAEAGEDPPRKRRKRFIVKNVRRVQGLARTNLVISERDARSLQAEAASGRILKHCRVIVIVSSSVGGVEGRRPIRPRTPAALAAAGTLPGTLAHRFGRCAPPAPAAVNRRGSSPVAGTSTPGFVFLPL